MEKKEIILSKIADTLSKPGFILKSNGVMKARLKCCGLNELYEINSSYLEPYSYRIAYGNKYENPNEEYSVFIGLDNIFSELYKENENEKILVLLKELTEAFNVSYIGEFLSDEFELLGNLYELLGLDLRIEYDKVIVTSMMQSNASRISELFSVENWLMENHSEVYDSYDSAINSFMAGNAGACIESCRTTLVSIFSKFKGTEDFAKWLRGIFNVSGEQENSTVQELDKAIKSSLRKEELADFFNENREGKLTKTKTIYMIYSMMSDYGTHRNESTKEVPSIQDAHFILRLTDSILFWVYSKV